MSVVYFDGPLHFIIGLSDLSLFLTLIACALGVVASGSNDLGFLAAHHLTFSLALGCDLLGFPVYWLLVHKSIMRKRAGDFPRIVQTWYNHCIPLFTILCNFWITDFKFTARIFKIILPVCFLTAYLNYK